MPLTLDEMAGKPRTLTLEEMAGTPQQRPADIDSLMSGEKKIEDFLPADTFADVTDPNDLKSKMVTSLFYSESLGISSDDAYNLHDALNKNVFGKEVPATLALKEIQSEYEKIPDSHEERLITALPEQNRIAQLIWNIKEKIREKTGYFEPPLYAGPKERIEQPIKTIASYGAFLGAKTLSGLGLNVPDIIANKLSGEQSLADLVNKTTGFTPTSKEITAADNAAFMAGLTTASGITRKFLTNVTARYGLKVMLKTGITFATRQTGEEIAKKFITGEPIDIEGIHFQGGLGVLFGAGEVGIQRLARFIQGVRAGTAIELYKAPEGSREASRAAVRKEVYDALNEYRTTGNRTKWDAVRQKYTIGPEPTPETPVEAVAEKGGIPAPKESVRPAEGEITPIAKGLEGKPSATEVEYVYHGTSEGAFRKIRQEGMVGKEKYFADTEQYAQSYADRKGTGERLLRIKRTEDIVSDKHIPEKGDFKTSRDITPQEIEVKVGKQWIPIQEYADIERNIMPIQPVLSAGEAPVKPSRAIKELKKLQPWEMMKEEYDTLYNKPEFAGQVTKQEQIQNYQNTLIKENEKLSRLRSSDSRFKQKQQIANTQLQISQLQDELNAHKYIVTKALNEGKPVPPEVLAEYPELAKQAPARIEIQNLIQKYETLKAELIKGDKQQRKGLLASQYAEVEKVRNEFYRIGQLLQQVFEANPDIAKKYVAKQAPAEPEAIEIPRQLTKAKHNALIRQVEKQITESDAYKEMLGGIEAPAQKISGINAIYVGPTEQTEVKEYIGKAGEKGYKDKLARMFTFNEKVRKIVLNWDEATDQLGLSANITELLEYLDMATSGVEGKGINIAALNEAIKSDPSMELFALKRAALKSGLNPDQINDIIKQWAADNSIEQSTIEPELIKVSEADYGQGKQEFLRELEKESTKTEKQKAATAKATRIAEAITKGEPTPDILKTARERAYKTKQPVYVYESKLTALKPFTIKTKLPTKGKYTKVWFEEGKAKQETGYIGLAPEQAEQATKLRHDIHAIAATKGLSKKTLSELKLQHTGYRHLAGKTTKNKITVEQLQSLLKAVQKARPRLINHKKVVTLKTEKRIQTLKENLTRKLQMTDEAWNDILVRETQGKEPKYIDAQNFITQEQGRNVLKRMHNTATLLRVTNAFEEALRKNPDKAAYTQEIDNKIKAVEHRDPHSLESMRYYNQQAQEKTGVPVYPVYKAMIDTEAESHRTREAQLKWLEAAVGEDNFAKIAGDEAALKRVSDYIDSKSHLENKPEMPKDITPGEIKFAQTIERILNVREIQSRLGKFFRWYELDFPKTGEGAMADYARYKKEIQKAVDIYDTLGEEELVEYLKTQDWGIIHSGYDPKELILRKIQLYTPGARAIGRGHIKVSNAVEFHEQERNILQRLNSYMRQMDTLSYMSPLINTYIQLYEDNAIKFDDWDTVKNSIELFLSELKHYNVEKNWLAKWVTRIYSQTAQAVLQNSPSITLYNAAEALAFAADKSTLFNPANEPLTTAETEFLETYVQQQRAMLEEYYLVNEKAFPGLEGLNKLARQLSLTSRSDVFSRYQTFWAKINQVKRALKLPTLAEQIDAMKLRDYSPLEQRMAMSIWSKDGPEVMARYLAKIESDNVHGRYSRAERSPAEMGSMGRMFANLMLFPRMWSERMARNAYKVIDPQADSKTKYRAAKTLLAAIIGGTIVGMGIGKISGRHRNPYSPIEILGWRFGGLLTGGMEKVSELYNTTLEMLSGDEITKKRAQNKWPEVLTAVPETFVPFYAHTIRIIEKDTGIKYIDRYALRYIREQLDKDYRMRPDAYRFNKKGIVNAVQYILIGRSTDIKEEEQQNIPLKR